jgi:hypothetical protein
MLERAPRGTRIVDAILGFFICSLVCSSIGFIVDAGSAFGVAVNPRPDDQVLVLPTDGRPAQGVTRIQRDEGTFLPLGSLACALGVSFGWDPYTYRGWIATDSLRTEFALDSPILNHGGDSVQIDAPIGYDEHGVLIPIDYLAVLAEQWNGGRSVSWQYHPSIFRWGSASPSFRQIRLGSVGHRSVLKVPMRAAPHGSTLLWSPVGRLEIFLDGVGVNADSLRIASPPRDCDIMVSGVAGAPRGSRICVDIAPSAIGASIGFDADEGSWRLATSSSVDEVGRGGFQGLPRADRPDRRTGASGPVLIAALFNRATDPAEADSALADLADRIARTLADTLLIRAEMLSARDPVNAARVANSIDARCVIALRLDRYATGTGRLQIWSAKPRLRWEPVDPTQSLRPVPPRPLLWSETPALGEAEGRRIATTLASHLGTLLGSDHVDMGARPSLLLEGFMMPAILIFPAQANDPLSIERLMDDIRRADLARAVAFGISEAMATTEDPSIGMIGGIRPAAAEESGESMAIRDRKADSGSKDTGRKSADTRHRPAKKTAKKKAGRHTRGRKG